MSNIILCRLTNTSKKDRICVNYVRASDEMKQYQVIINPGKSRNIWYIKDTLEVFPEELKNYLSVCIN